MSTGDTHPENLERVAARMSPAVKQFCREHKRFHADELRRYVIRVLGIHAPASADRILRLLRQQHELDYVVLSRRESLYETLWVRQEPGAPPREESTQLELAPK